MEIENIKKVKGYEFKIFIEENIYEGLKEKLKEEKITVDEYIEKLVKNNVFTDGEK